MPAKKSGASKDSEVHAYVWIKKNLEVLGWDVRNPERAAAGQVWTQNEVTHNEELKKYLVLDKPENVVKVNERVLWVIEAKRSHQQLQEAVREAEDYATKIRPSTHVHPLFISGVAGNDIDSFLVLSKFWDGTRYVTITLNGVSATGLLTPAHLDQILSTGLAEISDPQIDEQLFLARAEHINAILHHGAVNPHQRAGVMAALLLAMLSSTPPNIEERDPSTLISDINGRAQSILSQQGKANFFEYVRINLPSTPDNHVKLRRALVDTIQELNNLNIRSAMNSGSDWLGAFYEVFLKYANWAQDLGIVLTPRHITRFVADVMDVQTTDIVYDPTCGTGGFLVAAFDYVKVVSFPLDLFYPVAVASVGIFIRKGIPHPPQQNVLWLRAVNDGLLKRKGRRLPNPRATNDLARSRDTVKAFLTNPQYAVPNIERLQKACPIDNSDSLYELVPEAYLDQSLPTAEEIRDGIDQILRNSVAFMIRSRKNNEPHIQ